MSTHVWEVFMVVFTETDVVQHFFWRHMEVPTADDPPRHRTAVRDTYEHCDRVIGELMEAVGDDTVVMIVSDHGARYDDGLARAVPSWLEQLGLLNYLADERTNRLRSIVRTSITKLFRQADKRLSPEAKHKLARRIPWLRRRVDVMLSFARVDWSRTKAYTDGKRP